jgi:hypothetical protein
MSWQIMVSQSATIMDKSCMALGLPLRVRMPGLILRAIVHLDRHSVMKLAQALQRMSITAVAVGSYVQVDLSASRDSAFVLQEM